MADMLTCTDNRPVPYDCVVTPLLAEVESILAEEREHFGIYSRNEHRYSVYLLIGVVLDTAARASKRQLRKQNIISLVSMEGK